MPPSVTSGSLELNGALLNSITSIADGETTGLILSVQVTNPSSDEIILTIPCGLIFEPSSRSEEQRLMVIQQASGVVLPGETLSLTPYVVCIDSTRSAPTSGSAYQVGTIASDDILKLAMCICQEELSTDLENDPNAFNQQLGVQFAVWAVAEDLSLEGIAGAAGEGVGAVGQLEEIYGPLIQLFSSFGQEWLDKCDIEIKP